MGGMGAGNVGAASARVELARPKPIGVDNMANIKSIETTIATDTSTGVERGKDVGFDLTLDDGRVLSGEVTLLPHEDGRPGYGAWGEPAHWLEGRTLSVLLKLPDDEFTEALNTIECACAAAIH